MKLATLSIVLILMAASLPSEAQSQGTRRNALQHVQASIDKSGKLAVDKSTFVRSNEALYGKARVLPAERTIAARLTKPGQAKPKSTITEISEIGESPDGFGKVLLWDPADAGLAVVVFLSAADHHGVMISGVKPTDTIEFVSATGIASFSEDTTNERAGALIGIIAAGAGIGASAFGVPEVAPLIAPAAEFARTQFKEEKVKTLRRDPFGEDPGSGQKARAEGGVLVSMPEAGQAFYSGTADHKDRWIKEPGTRDNFHHPAHVHDAFFLQSGRDPLRKTLAEGDFIIYPWDQQFEDNFGFYRLHVLLRRGDGRVPQ